MRQVKLRIHIVGVTIIPSNELGSGITTRQHLTRNIEFAVCFGSDSEDYLVVMCLEILQINVTSELDIPKETKPWICGNFLISLDDGFDVLMIRSDSKSNETVRHWKSIKSIHLNQDIFSPQQGIHRIETGWTCANHSHS